MTLLYQRLRATFLAIVLTLLALPTLANAQESIAPADYITIQNTISRMNYLIDQEDYQTYLTLWAEDATFNSGFAPETTGRAAILDFLETMQAQGAITGKRHVASNLVLSADGEQIVVTYYLTVLERETLPALVATAFITDVFEQRDGEWLIVRHVTSVDPAVMNAMQQQ